MYAESLSESSDDGGDVNKKAKKLKGGKEGEEEMEVGVEASTLQLKGTRLMCSVIVQVEQIMYAHA